MNFEDKLQIQLKVYNVGYVQVGDKFFDMDTNGNPTFDIESENAGSGYNEDGDPITATAVRFYDFGKCTILPNTSAKVVTLADGKKYVYSYEVIAPLSTLKYKLLPREGEIVHITKKDCTIDRDMEVKGFVTLKRRYIKLWL